MGRNVMGNAWVQLPSILHSPEDKSVPRLDLQTYGEQAMRAKAKQREEDLMREGIKLFHFLIRLFRFPASPAAFAMLATIL